MMRRGLFVVVLACGCSTGVDAGNGFAFGGMPPGGGANDDEDGGDEESSSDDDDGVTSGVGSLDTGGLESGGSSGNPPDTLPPPDDTSGPPPDDTSGPPPDDTSGPPDPSGGSSGMPEIGSTSSPLGETSFGGTTTGVGAGGLGDPCEDNADCQTNVCVNAGFFLYCSDFCVTEADCPPGWLCVETTTEGVNVCY